MERISGSAPRGYGSPLDLVAGLMMDSTFIHVLNFAELPPLVLELRIIVIICGL